MQMKKEPRATGHQTRRLPAWLKRSLPAGRNFSRTQTVLSSLGLETICTNANCPNRGECWNRGTATVLILGNICTRDCKFCSVAKGKPQPPDPNEPAKLAQMTKQMNLKYLVITSVSRDDLPDGGASHFRDCINTVRKKLPFVEFEILTPDFRNCQKLAIEILTDALPFIFAHNIETVPRFYSKARRGADYQLSLNLLKMAKEYDRNIQTKSSIMLGLGEADSEVEQVLQDLCDVGCDRITIGQYLKPSKDCLEVAEFVKPEKFEYWKQKAVQIGFKWVLSSPFTRSSYFAELENSDQAVSGVESKQI
jgi:lipoic acid synthetase